MKTTSDIIGKYLSGNCSPEEVLWVQEQLASSSAFKSEYESLSRIWGLTNKLDYDSSPMEESWQLFKANVKAPTRGIGFDWLKVAASILLLAAFSVIIFNFTTKGDSYIASDQLIEASLEDGSLVELNTHSSLLLSKKFNSSNRSLALEGEAFFQVEKGEHDFVVELNGGSLRVTGTQFNVFNPEGSDYVAVDLYEGGIELKLGKRIKQIKAGSHVEWDGSELYIAKLNETAPSWTSDTEIYCKNVPLQHIMLELQKQYGVEFDVPKRKLKERYTVSLPKGDLTTCVALIADLTDLPLQLDGRTISLK